MKIEDKRSAVLQSMMELVTEKGFHGTAMSMVAKRAGVAAGTIYHYFESKEEIINELYRMLKQRMEVALLQDETNRGTIKDQFFRFYLQLYHYFTEHAEEFRFMEQYANSPYVSQAAREENQRFNQPVFYFLQQGIELGVLRPLDLRLMRALVYGHVVSLANLQLSEEMQLSQTQLEQAVQSCWDGIRIN